MKRDGSAPEVLIVGAGPTGLMLAVWLAASGVEARVVDSKAGPTRETRAVAVQARTLEHWRMLGIADRALAEGRQAEATDIWVEGRCAARLRLGETGEDGTPYPFALLLGQDATERLLYERLKEFGGDVEWGVRVEAIDGNQATLGEEKALFRYIVGCDGARSIVRKAVGLEFAGGTYAARFYVADVDAVGGVVSGEINLALFRDRFLAFFPLKEKDRYRMVGLLDPELDPETATINDVQPELERLMQTKIQAVRWFSVYRVHHRSIGSFRRGSILLAGDAAHVHSPVGGQGMNTGLGDATNLAWKLVEVLRHGADDRLLDSYDDERRPIAERLVATTDRAFELIVRQGTFARFLRTRVAPLVLPVLFRLRAVRRLAFLTLSQTRIHYRKGPLARGRTGEIQGGDRLSPNLVADGVPGRWRLVLAPLEPAGAAAWCKARDLDLCVVPKGEFALLVRPDGYVGLAAEGFEVEILDRYFHEVVGRPS